MSLYRKYRPKDFPGLIGQEHIKITLLNAIKAGQIAHAYLFTGPRGTGKTTTARLLAKAINAEIMTEDGRFDGSELAEEIDAGRLIDVIEIDAASNRGIDEIRDLREKISYAPTRAKNKVYIIDEVHMLTKEAFNALLKTLEEPPGFVYFILATTEIQKVPETIISRCQRFDFRRISEDVLVGHLKQVAEIEGVVAEDEALRIVAKHARGGARDALTLLEQITSNRKLETSRVKEVLGISNLAACENLYEDLKIGNAAGGMEKLHAVFQSGVDLVQFNRDFLDFLRQKMLTSVREGNNSEARHFIELIGYFQEAYEKQKFSYIPELPLEVAIAKSCLGTVAKEEGTGQRIPGNKIGTGSSQVTTPMKNSGAGVAVSSPVPETLKQIPNENAAAQIAATPMECGAADPANPLAPDLDALLKNWSAVLDRVHNPLARRCLMAGKPVEIKDNNLILAFQNNFNKEKLFIPELLAVVEKAIEEGSQMKLKLVGKVDPMVVPTAAPTAAAGSNGSGKAVAPAQKADGENGTAKSSAGADNGDDLLTSALNVFGGEVA